jgi:hypothetical protein
MRNTVPDQQAKAQHRQRLVVWFSLLMSLGMYIVVMQLAPPATPRENPGLVTGLMVAAIGMVALSFWVKSRLSGGPGRGRTPRQTDMAYIIPPVMCEAAAVFGVVVWFVTASIQAYYFVLLGLAGLLFHYPKRPE